MSVNGDCDGIDQLSRTTGASAMHAQTQANTYGSALSLFAPQAFLGGKADATRAFTRQMQAAAAIAATSYDNIASFLPRVSAAIREAQADQRALDEANTQLAQAKSAADAAAGQVAIAAAALLAAESALAAANVVGALVAHPNTAAEQAAVRVAQQRVASAEAAQRRAQHALDAAERAQRKAKRAFDEADDKRQSILAQFQRLCDSEAAILYRALPSTPPPSFVSIVQEQNLERGVTGLLALPALVTADASCGLPLTGLRRMSSHQDYAGILRNFNALYPPPPTPKPAPAHHDWYDVALHAVGHFVVHDIPHGFVKIADGAKDGTVGIGTGFAALVEQEINRTGLNGMDALLAQRFSDQEAGYTLVHHPVESIVNASGIKAFLHDPLHASGELLPGALLTAATDGAGAELRAVTSTDEKLRETASFHDAIAANRPASASAVVAREARLRSRDLEPRLTQLRTANAGLKAYGKAGTVAGVNGFIQDNGQSISGCTPYAGEGLAPGWLVGKSASLAHHLP